MNTPLRLRRVLYLSNSEGFPGNGNKWLLAELARRLQEIGYEVWNPFNRNGQSHFLYGEGDDFNIARDNITDILKSDVLMAVVNGTPPNHGVFVELGIAIAKSMPTFIFDACNNVPRRPTVSKKYPEDIMLFSGMPADKWQDHYYTTLEEISDPNKALFRFNMPAQVKKW